MKFEYFYLIIGKGHDIESCCPKHVMLKEKGNQLRECGLKMQCSHTSLDDQRRGLIDPQR